MSIWILYEYFIYVVINIHTVCIVRKDLKQLRRSTLGQLLFCYWIPSGPSLFVYFYWSAKYIFILYYIIHSVLEYSRHIFVLVFYIIIYLYLFIFFIYTISIVYIATILDKNNVPIHKQHKTGITKKDLILSKSCQLWLFYYRLLFVNNYILSSSVF